MARGYEETESSTLKRGIPVPPREADIYDVHRQAVNDWHNAWREADMALQRRDQLRVELEKITHDFAQHLARNEYDPTKPQPPEVMNGKAMQAAQQVPGNARGW